MAICDHLRRVQYCGCDYVDLEDLLMGYLCWIWILMVWVSMYGRLGWLIRVKARNLFDNESTLSLRETLRWSSFGAKDFVKWLTWSILEFLSILKLVIISKDWRFCLFCCLEQSSWLVLYWDLETRQLSELICIWKLLLLVLWWLFKFTNFSWSRSACYGLTSIIVENLIFVGL